MARKKRTPPKPELHLRLDLDDDERVEGRDGRPLRIDDVVRRVAYFSRAMGVEVSSRVGRVVRRYRNEPDGPVILDFRGRDSEGQGLYTGRAADCQRSSASVHITTQADRDAHEERLRARREAQP